MHIKHLTAKMHEVCERTEHWSWLAQRRSGPGGKNLMCLFSLGTDTASPVLQGLLVATIFCFFNGEVSLLLLLLLLRGFPVYLCRILSPATIRSDAVLNPYSIICNSHSPHARLEHSPA